MSRHLHPAVHVLLLLIMSTSTSACQSTGPVRADPTSPPEIVLNDQRYESEFSGSLGTVDRRVRAVMKGLGLEISEGAAETRGVRNYRGRGPDRSVQVTVRRIGAQTVKISVYSVRLTMTRSGVLEADPGFARRVVEAIHAAG